MAYNFSPFKTKVSEINDWLAKEYSSVRTGKASPLILDSVYIESYGSRVPIKHVAAVSIEDAKTLRVTLWDKSQIRAVETAISASNLGLSTAPDSSGIRVIFPDLTDERRKTLSKVIKDKLEEAKVSLRKERERVWNDIQAEEKKGSISEDEKFHQKDELQKMVDESNRAFEDTAGRKEKEIAG